MWRLMWSFDVLLKDKTWHHWEFKPGHFDLEYDDANVPSIAVLLYIKCFDINNVLLVFVIVFFFLIQFSSLTR